MRFICLIFILSTSLISLQGQKIYTAHPEALDMSSYGFDLESANYLGVTELIGYSSDPSAWYNKGGVLLADISGNWYSLDIEFQELLDRMFPVDGSVRSDTIGGSELEVHAIRMLGDARGVNRLWLSATLSRESQVPFYAMTSVEVQSPQEMGSLDNELELLFHRFFLSYQALRSRPLWDESGRITNGVFDSYSALTMRRVDTTLVPQVKSVLATGRIKLQRPQNELQRRRLRQSTALLIAGELYRMEESWKASPVTTDILLDTLWKEHFIFDDHGARTTAIIYEGLFTNWIEVEPEAFEVTKSEGRRFIKVPWVFDRPTGMYRSPFELELNRDVESNYIVHSHFSKEDTLYVEAPGQRYALAKGEQCIIRYPIDRYPRLISVFSPSGNRLEINSDAYNQKSRLAIKGQEGDIEFETISSEEFDKYKVRLVEAER